MPTLALRRTDSTGSGCSQGEIRKPARKYAQGFFPVRKTHNGRDDDNKHKTQLVTNVLPSPPTPTTERSQQIWIAEAEQRDIPRRKDQATTHGIRKKRHSKTKTVSGEVVSPGLNVAESSCLKSKNTSERNIEGALIYQTRKSCQQRRKQNVKGRTSPNLENVDLWKDPRVQRQNVREAAATLGSVPTPVLKSQEIQRRGVKPKWRQARRVCREAESSRLMSRRRCERRYEKNAEEATRCEKQAKSAKPKHERRHERHTK